MTPILSESLVEAKNKPPDNAIAKIIRNALNLRSPIDLSVYFNKILTFPPPYSDFLFYIAFLPY